ncbi:PEP-CTERM sorting domain-containing protein [Ideonella sp. DXS22W]|uniref:PEP-CTERM sorting domain-containing protein n=1 Tax=Pseudaquabacterium inlustre TaxID=2984192 RepID=A0ABU9CMM6_9BURK
MNTFRTPFALLAGAAALALGAPATAADATTSVQVTQLQFVTGNGLTLQWLDGFGFQSAFAESREAGGLGGNSLREPDPLLPASGAAAQSLATATAHAVASVSADADGRSLLSAGAWRFIVTPDLSQPHTGQAWLQQASGFTLSGAGQVTVLVDYTLSVASPFSDGGHSWALAALTLNAGNLDTGTSFSAERLLASPLLSGGSGTDSGRVSFVIDVDNAQQTGWFSLRSNVDVSAAAAVPEPQAWALFALGLGTLLLAARRRGR